MSIQNRMVRLLGEADAVDTITVDVPLFIRLLEYAREDAKTDMDLHNLTTNVIKASKAGTLTMADYGKLVSKKD